jgi:MOSC domain-containing protein
MSARMSVAGEVLARVAELWRYPVKSIAGERLPAAEVGFPWLTIREQPLMLHYRPTLLDRSRPDESDLSVRTPAGAELDVIDPALAAELAPGARPIKLDRGVFDTSPISLLSRQGVSGIAELAATELDVRRFRPNLVLEADGAFPEDDWVGATLAIGSARIRVDRRDQRCVVVNVDPASSRRDSSVLQAITRERQACLGVYGTTVRPGAIQPGDTVRQIEPGEPATHGRAEPC